MNLYLTKDTFETANLGGHHSFPERGQTIVSSPRILLALPTDFQNEALIEQSLQIIVKSPWPELVLAVGLKRDFLHDSVAVTVFAGKRDQDMKDCGGQGEDSCQARCS